jgi:hypothetical protein
MGKRIPPEVLEYLKGLGKQYGKLGGKKAAKNMTAEERSARAKKASDAAARNRTAERLARERKKKSPGAERTGRALHYLLRGLTTLETP